MKQMLTVLVLLFLLLPGWAIGESVASPKLVLPEETKRIEAEAFADTVSVDEIVLPEGLVYIGSRAFAGSGMKRLTIPNSVAEMAEDAFEGVCADAVVTVTRNSYAYTYFQTHAHDFVVSAGAAVTPWESLEYRMTDNEDGLTVTISGLRESVDSLVIDEYMDGRKIDTLYVESMYTYDYSLTGSLTFPDVKTYIRPYAFAWQTGLNGTLTLPSQGSVMDGAFASCTGLRGTLEIPAGVVIGASSFSGCTGFTSLSFEEGWTNLDELGLSGWTAAFQNCTGLTGKIVFPEGLQEIGGSAFAGCTGIAGIELPKSLKTIGDFAFENCTGLTDTVCIPGAVEIVGDVAFGGCTEIDEVTLEEGITGEGLGNGIFSGCTSLKRVSIPQSMTRIPGRMFTDCTELNWIRLPAAVEMIDYYAFANCTSLKRVPGLFGCWSIGNSAFMGCTGLSELDLNAATIGKDAFKGCTGLRGVEMSAEMIELGDGAFEGCIRLEIAYMHGTTLRKIGASAFKDCTNLKKINFPAGLTSVGERAFAGCVGLTGVVELPDTVGTYQEALYGYGKLGDAAFENCTGLAGVSLANNFDVVSGLRGDPFQGVSADFVIYCAKSDVTAWAEARGYRCVSARLYGDGISCRLPEDELYQGDRFIVRASITARTTDIQKIRATILDAQETVLQQTEVAITNGTLSLTETFGTTLHFETLPLGQYRFVLSAVYDEAVVGELKSSRFAVVEPPVRIVQQGVSQMATGVWAETFQMSGTLTFNYPIQAIDASLRDLTAETDAVTYHAEPMVNTFELANMNDHFGLTGEKGTLEPLHEYRFTLKYTAKDETKTLLNTTFVVSNAGKSYSAAEMKAIAEFVSDMQNAWPLFEKYGDGVEYIGNLGFWDGFNMCFQGALNCGDMFVNVGADLLGANSPYLVNCYKAQIVNVLSEVDSDLDLVHDIEEPWYVEKIDAFRKGSSTGIKGISLILNDDKQVKKFIDGANMVLKAAGQYCDTAEFGVLVANHFEDIFKEYENAIRILDMYVESMKVSDPAFLQAAEELLEEYTNQTVNLFCECTEFMLDYALEESIESVAEESAPKILAEAINLWKIGGATGEEITSILKIVVFALDYISKCEGWDEQASGIVDLVSQQSIFSNATSLYQDAFLAVRNGDTSVEAIAEMELWFRTARASGKQVYSILHDLRADEIWPDKLPYDDKECQRLTKLWGELELLIYDTPFGSDRD